MSTWKVVEKNIARYLGGERVPITGRFRGSAPDIDRAKVPLVALPDSEEFAERDVSHILNGYVFDKHVFELKHRKNIADCWIKLVSSADVLWYNGYYFTTLQYFRMLMIDEVSIFDTTFEIYPKPKKIPAWILDAFDQAIASDKNKIPTVVLHQKNMKINKSIVICKRIDS